MNRPAQLEDQAIRIPIDAPRPERLVRELRVNFLSPVWTFIAGILMFSGVTNLALGASVLAGMNDSSMPRSTGAVMALAGLSMAVLAAWLYRRNKRRVASRSRALLEGARCPARLLSVRKSYGLNLTFLLPDFLHQLDVQLPDQRVLKHELKLPLDASDKLDDRDDLFVLVHLPSEAVFVPEALRHVVWTD